MPIATASRQCSECTRLAAGATTRGVAWVAAALVFSSFPHASALIHNAHDHQLVRPESDLAADLQRLIFMGRPALRAAANATASEGPIDPPSAPSRQEFLPLCGNVSRALVFEDKGNKEKVGTRLDLVCARMEYPPDNQRCQDFRASFLAGLTHDADWNEKEMDYGLFCMAIYKVVADLPGMRANYATVRE